MKGKNDLGFSNPKVIVFRGFFKKKFIFILESCLKVISFWIIDYSNIKINQYCVDKGHTVTFTNYLHEL